MSIEDNRDHLNDSEDDEYYEAVAGSPVGPREDDNDPDYEPGEHEDEDEDQEDEEAGVDEEDIRIGNDLFGVDSDGAEGESDDGHQGNDAPSLDSSRNALLALLYRYGSLRTYTTPPTRPDTEEDLRDPAGWSSTKGGYKDSDVSDPRGIELLRSGQFGSIARTRYTNENKPVIPSVTRTLLDRKLCLRRISRDEFSRNLIPNTHGTTVATYDSKAYVGQFSADSSFYYTCCQDFRLHVYDTSSLPGSKGSRTISGDGTHRTTMKITSTISGALGQWTITDSHLNHDNSALIYSSLTPTVYMTNPQDPTATQIPIHFGSSARQTYWGHDSHFALYSCRFSASGTEIVAGGNGHIYVYDLGAMRRTLQISAHDDDINSCCWADTTSGNVLVSASDDCSLKVWDRRSLGQSSGAETPTGVLAGHTEGITHVSPKGDGRYVISNGKDQVLRLWDLRKMRSHHEWVSTSRSHYGNWDYRSAPYPKPRKRAHPLDTSVMQYKGHFVMRTLIRCHFSPLETTGQSYIYSGSADGLIHIWSLDGRVVQVLDRSKTLPISFDPSAPDPPERQESRYRGGSCVRDVSWHTYEPVLMSTAWASRGMEDNSSIARHEWKGYGKNAMTIEDVLERERLHEAEWKGIS